MSDENEKDHEYFTNLLENYKNRLVIAEKEIHLLNNFKVELIDLDRVDNERISELEASSASHTEFYDVVKRNIVLVSDWEWRIGIIDRIINTEKEIAELKDWFLKYHDYELEKVQDQLNELGTRIGNAFEAINELKNNHTALDDISKFMFNKVALNLEKIEDRLSGGTDKDSGGENEPLECYSGIMGIDSSEDNSKLSEPAMGKKCLKCDGWNPNEYASECEDMYNAIIPRCATSEDRLPGGTGIEPREDDVKLCPICGKWLDGDKECNDYALSLIPVKREDLKRWCKLLYDADFEKEYDYIKEEYNL